MNWSTYHTQSEQLASLAEEETRRRRFDSAVEFYRAAAEHEQHAFDYLDESKVRTRGITAVSAVSLWFKAREFHRAKNLAYRCLGTDLLPTFAVDQLEELLQIIQSEEAIRKSGVEFTNQVLVSVSGGEVVRGGAPLDLIHKKVDEVGKLFYRTIEMLLRKPLRKRGAPSQEVQEQCRPWLFQAPAGSYQFAVRVQKPAQLNLFPDDVPDVEVITQTVIDIIRAGTQDVEGEKLSEIVSDKDYQKVFLKLTQNLAPGEKDKSFSRLEIKVPFSDSELASRNSVILVPESREITREILKKNRYESISEALYDVKEIQIKGILRGLQLDNDWLEIKTGEQEQNVLRISGAGDAVDDVVGPMVNRRVIVDVVERGDRYIFRDIQTED